MNPDAKGVLKIVLNGNNCKIVIDENIYVSHDLTIVAGQDHPNFGLIENTEIFIGKNSTFESATIITFNSNAKIQIGERCMFSFGINLYHTDGHPIFDKNTSKIINKVRTMSLGNHVWLGWNATILKNVCIPDDCIIG